MRDRVLGLTVFLSIAVTSASAQPNVRLRLSESAVLIGEPVKVKVKTVEDGHLLVLRMDTEGRIRVLFPVAPHGADRVRGGKELEIRSRDSREAFSADERAGRGMVLAVRSEQPFAHDVFAEFERWSLTALTPDTLSLDPEGALLRVVAAMQSSRFDYDAVSYRVGAPLPRADVGRPTRRTRVVAFLGMWNAWSAWSPWFVPASAYGVPTFAIGFDFGTYFPVRSPRSATGWHRR